LVHPSKLENDVDLCVGSGAVSNDCDVISGVKVPFLVNGEQRSALLGGESGAFSEF
jgi:hypothetical protein